MTVIWTSGRKLFQELDRDGDGHATLSDIEEAIRRRKLPPFYASEIITFAKKKNWLSKSFGWDEFSSLIKEKEPKMLSAFNSVSLCNCGTIHKRKLKALLQSASVPATERNVTAMLHFLNSDKEDSVSYSQFRNFMLFVPTELIVNDPWTIWFEAATRRSTDMLLQTVPAVGKNRTLTSYTQDIWKIGPLASSLSIASPLQKLSHLATQLWKMRLLTRVNHEWVYSRSKNCCFCQFWIFFDNMWGSFSPFQQAKRWWYICKKTSIESNTMAC